MISKSTAIFASADIAKTLQFYKDVLGFETTWTWGDPPTFGTASIGGVTVMFGLDPDLAGKVQGHSHFFEVDDADAWYSRHLENGAKIVSDIEDKPWGLREYEVEDPSGYRLRFAGPLSFTPGRAEPMPEGIRFERRLPAQDESTWLYREAFDDKKADGSFVAMSWNGVVAVLEDGTACGMVRIVNEARGWYSIWDVAVVPELQGRGIGRRMVDEALEMIREASPGAWVYLFTYKPKFYEKLGFGQETVTMRKV